MTNTTKMKYSFAVIFRITRGIRVRPIFGTTGILTSGIF